MARPKLHNAADRHDLHVKIDASLHFSMATAAQFAKLTQGEYIEQALRQYLKRGKGAK